ncbi:MAG: XdhC family protein [Solirubrobacterales bacterium]
MTTARRVAGTAARWLEEGRRVVAALLVQIDGSAPLDLGARMLVTEDGQVEGSITGGCVEAAVVREAMAIFAGGNARLVAYGISDELAGSVGLTCGGTVHIFVHELRGEAAALEARAGEAAEAGEAVAVATLLDGPGAGRKLLVRNGAAAGSLGGPELLDHSVARDAEGILADGHSRTRRYSRDGATLGAELTVHVTAYGAAPKMLIFGAIDFAAALASLASELGYEVIISDPRRAFLNAPHFRRAAMTLVGWPEAAFEQVDVGPRDAVLVLSHDPKLDRPALLGALATQVGYIGALGSRRTTADRNRRLLESGVGEEGLARVNAPCGLDIGSATPEEVAVSILAEIIAKRSGRPGMPLRDSAGSIHRRRLAGQR